MRLLLAGAATLIALTGCDERSPVRAFDDITPDINDVQTFPDEDTVYLSTDAIRASIAQEHRSNAVAIRDAGRTRPDRDPGSGTTSETTCESVILDFDTDPLGTPIPAGQDVFLTYASLGIQVFALESQQLGGQRKPITFDSSAPTGGDRDLGTPNADFGGPGQGDGGAAGTTGENAYDLNNVLIIAENETDSDGDGLVDVPDDEANGGWIIMFLGREYCINSLTMIDIEAAEENEVIFYNQRRRAIFETTASGLGNNSIEELEFSVCGVQEIWFYLSHSGAIDNIDMCVDR